MTWWDAVRIWLDGKREEKFPVPGASTPEPSVEYNGAAEWLAKRANLTTVMNSREIAEEWTAKARAQAFFAARVAEDHILERLRDVSDALSRGEIGLAESRTELTRFLREEGKDDGTSGLRNLASTARLDLILEQNARMAAAVGQYQAGMDPDIRERFPCWRYIGSTALNPRDSHARFAGKVFRKDDPIWHKIFPPSDFNCKCSVEDCDDEPDRVPETIEPPESGFTFDPAHAFEEFDLSSIRNEELRKKTEEGLRERFGVETNSNKYRELPIGEALRATEQKNLAIFGEEYLRAEQNIQKRVDRIREKLQEQLDVNSWAAFIRVNQRQTRLKQIQEDMVIRLAVETLGKEIPVKAVIKTETTRNVAGVTQQIKGVLEKCVSGDIVTQGMVLSVVKVPRATKSERAFYSLATKKLNLNTHPESPHKLSTGIHESMHWLEDFNTHVHKRCVEFLEHRCKGETPQSLRRLTGLGYRPTEKARPDNFFNAYCGKDYVDINGNRYATEVLSMGVEQMLRGPVAFAKQDPEYFNFVVSVLKGEI